MQIMQLNSMIDTFCHLTEYFYCYKLLQQFFVSLGPSADSIVPNVHLAKAVMPQYYAIVTILLFMGHRSGDQALGNISSFYLGITIFFTIRHSGFGARIRIYLLS